MVIETLLQTAWDHRWNQRIEAAMQGLAEVQARAEWAELNVEGLKAQGEEYLEALLLKSSLMRAQGLKSSALLAKIQQQWDALARVRPFRLLFELGLEYWAGQDRAKALEFFLLAGKKARSDAEKLFATSNVLWCLEDLDLKREETEAEVARLLGRVGHEAPHVAGLWQAYRFRARFYREMAAPSEAGEGLSHFFSHWVSSLPYMGDHPVSFSQDYLWQGSYRLRTLARIWIPADQTCARVSDGIDRLYLWTWLAMAGRPEVTKEKNLYTLESILRDFEFDQVSRENALLFRNALGWMRILYPAIQEQTKSVFDRLARLNSPNYPLLEAEFNLMLHLSTEKGEAALFEKFPAFQKIFREMHSSLPALREQLTPLMALSRRYDLIVDLARGEVLLPAKGKLVPSKALAQFLSELSARDGLRLDELPSAEPAGLLYRARKLLGAEAIIRRNMALTRGPRWPKTLVLPEADLPSFVMAATTPSLVESEAHLQAAKALLPISFRRKELEKKLSVSKATANRMIEGWAREGRLLARGKAKATEYFWREEKV